MTPSYGSAEALLSHLRNSHPIVGVRPHVVEQTARRMVAAFPGDTLYAVKCNDTPSVLDALWKGGIRHFDTASIGEVRAVRRQFPGAVCHFMHPVKSPEAIAEAYFQHGVRSFVLDHEEELAKIVQVTERALDLDLFVRLAVPGDGAVLTLTGKFGCEVDEAPPLVRAARAYGRTVGLTFHVGSQCLDPLAFRRAIALCGEVVRETGPVDMLDVGGGFPGRYKGDEPLFDQFVATIRKAVIDHGLEGTPLQCEPGRALVADGASVLARVELRRGSSLYLNDGVYGNLAELKWIGPQFPLRAVRPDGRRSDARQMAFDLFGPTCDSIDSMPGPHWLPADMDEGDWIEVGQMGAYSNALRTNFNGFETGSVAFLHDEAFDRRSLDQAGHGGARRFAYARAA
ncbi:MAG TPA: type III PLP-dependent enzyme [Geminicoccus sp.]|jgi:ornithine decarboxylase|uniref:type III PLP-dependent enzyme n=1 Tax=Geminicoccus sp. TaxID=2024832 RepID=UPI002E34EAC2|nr:type III PLP-dependent enzyme [Geminicoccus sp.]HEX2525770.1 type III PLP-dependent enzyme [Geminicoccus sp.]